MLPQSARSALFLYMARMLASLGRCVGGQFNRFKIFLKAALKKNAIPPDQLETLAADRKGWRDICTTGILFVQATQDKTEDERRRRWHEHATRNRENNAA